MQSLEEEALLLGNSMNSFDLESSRKMKFSRGRSVSMSIHSRTSDDSERNNRESFTGPLTLRRYGEEQSSSIQIGGPISYTRDRDFIFEPSRIPLQQEAATPRLEPGMHTSIWQSESTEVQNEHLRRSGQLGMCNDPYCTLCPTSYHDQHSADYFRTTNKLDAKFQHLSYGVSKGFMERIRSAIEPYIPGIVNPHAKAIQRWNKLLVVSCFFAIFIDPFFFFLLRTRKDYKCISLNRSMATALVVIRSLTDFIYFLHILLQFRLAYVDPDSRVVGAGALVDDPRKIARKYMFGYFFLDFFVVLPLPQIIIFFLPYFNSAAIANNGKNLLRACILAQYIPRLYRFFPLFAGQSPTGFIFESAWSNFIINLLMFVLAGHAIGSFWYLFALQRVNQCLRNVCHDSKKTCWDFLDCGHDQVSEYEKNPTWIDWKNNSSGSACFNQEGGFPYGIYKSGVALTAESSLVKRYIFSLFWGFQQISTLAGNQVPSYYEGEVLFVMWIIGIGLILFALLIGNMQNFLQSLGRRRLEMTLRRRDIERWMHHRRLPENLRGQVREAEQFHWAATQGVNEEMLMENMPEDLQRDLRRHLFTFVKRVQIFKLLDDPILDVIRERLRTTTFVKGGEIFVPGGLINKMVFIIRGKMESIGEDRTAVQLYEGGVCGEELLTWYLDLSAVKKDGTRIRIPKHGCRSDRLVRCLTNVEAFVLRAADLEEITGLFARFLKSPEVQGAIRYDSPYWRAWAATKIQVAWRYQKKRLSRCRSQT